MEASVYVIALLTICVYVCSSSVTVDPNMCGIGVCCTNFILIGDRCIVCSAGRVGENCSKHCIDGFYGQKCKMKCPLECNKTCDKVYGLCPGYSSGYMKDDTTENDLKEKLAEFLGGKMWMIIGVSSIFVSFSCIGALLICKKCKRETETVTRTFYISDQNSQQLNGLRYESDGFFSNNSSTLQPPPRTQQNGTLRGDNATTQPDGEYSKSKKRYSLVRKITISREMTSHSKYSDDNEDLYDSDEFDNSFDVSRKVQISDLPKKDSFKTFQSEDINSKEAYGKVWL
ncbi:uncharacterized protein [Magallana gigas]|uniref:uncharacterized protein isoform X2 n=1 Tax=Magallana gigas TaxID=29159 RepID=UPI003342B984